MIRKRNALRVLLFTVVLLLFSVLFYHFYWSNPHRVLEWVLGVKLPPSASNVFVEYNRPNPDMAVVYMRSVMNISEEDAHGLAQRLHLIGIPEGSLTKSMGYPDSQPSSWWTAFWQRQKTAKIQHSWWKANGNLAPESVGMVWADGEAVIIFGGIPGTAAL